MRRLALAGSLVAALAANAGANGRPPGVVDIHFEQTAEQNVIAGTTFGLIISHDGGTTWRWMCEKAAHYGGMFDPDYSYSQSGAIFATSFDGLLVNRDGCTFEATPPGNVFVTTDELGPDHAFYYGAGDPADAKIYKSTNDGTTFPTSAGPGLDGDWWNSLAVAPGDNQRVYLSGYRLVGTNPKVFLLFKSTNGGTGYTAMSTTGITTSQNSLINIVGVSAQDPQILYIQVTLDNAMGTMGDSIYQSTNGGGSWTKILSKNDPLGLAFVVRANGDLVAATKTLGAWKSTNGGGIWTDLTLPPHIGCLTENAAGEVWACTQNFSNPQLTLPSDGYGIMKSTDLVTWTPVMKFQDILGPVPCAAGTIQRDMCQGSGPASPWCMVKTQLGITSTEIDCPAFTVDGAPDAGSGSNVNPPKGCCDTGSSGGPAILLSGVVAGFLLFRRRPKEK